MAVVSYIALPGHEPEYIIIDSKTLAVRNSNTLEVTRTLILGYTVSGSPAGDFIQGFRYQW